MAQMSEWVKETEKHLDLVGLSYWCNYTESEANWLGQLLMTGMPPRVFLNFSVNNHNCLVVSGSALQRNFKHMLQPGTTH